MSSSASTDTFPALPADVAETRRAGGITIAPEAALHRALQERTDELERVRRERDDAQAIVRRMLAQDAQDIDTLTRERDEARAALIAPPTAPDVGSTTSAPAAGAADPPRRRTPDEIRAWAAGLFGP